MRKRSILLPVLVLGLVGLVDWGSLALLANACSDRQSMADREYELAKQVKSAAQQLALKSDDHVKAATLPMNVRNALIEMLQIQSSINGTSAPTLGDDSDFWVNWLDSGNANLNLQIGKASYSWLNVE